MMAAMGDECHRREWAARAGPSTASIRKKMQIHLT